ncbi:MAG: GDP-mannose 4,6-dehydratase [Candidatus Riflebacteria bacterium]|nr:GDP-mannose 4,6-dehydratase [Candidatus Riflebacteria bacterium]
MYGNSARAPFTEDDPAVEPISPYGASKRAAELVAHSFHHLTGLPTTILRLFTVYGPRQRPGMAIHRFTRKVLAGESIPLFGDGATKRDYTFVSDIVDGILACLALGSGLATVNLGGAHPVSLKELVELIAKVCDRPARVEHHPPQPGDVELTCADISRAGRVLGFCPRVGLLQGLERFVHWFKEQTVAV